jgi:hypothetical protein
MNRRDGAQEQVRRWIEVGALVLLALVVSVTVWRAGRSVDGAAKEAIVTEAKAGDAIDALNATLAAVNRPCGKEKPCGTLGTLDKAVTKAGDAVVTTQLAERRSVPHVLAAMDEFKAAAGQLSAMADAGTGTAQAATAALETAQKTLADAQPVLEALQRDEDAANRAVADFDDLVRSPDLASTMQHVEGMAASGDKMMATGNAVWTKWTYPYLHPSKNPFKRAWQQTSPFIVAGAKVTATLF